MPRRWPLHGPPPLPLRLYSSLYWPASPAIAAYLASRADSRERWRDYLARGRFDGAAPRPGCLWVHAVSAGEVLSVAPLADALRRLLPAIPDTLLTTTIADALRIAAHRASGTYGCRTFLPLDATPLMKRFIRTVRPGVVLLSETDLWPRMLWELGRRRVPVYLVNGRISERAGRGYARLRKLFGPSLEAVRIFFVQSEADAERLAAAGAPEERLRVRSNTKYDRPGGAPDPENPASRWLRGAARRIIVAGSTHDREEELILGAVEGMEQTLTVLAPRNPERAADVARRAPGAMLWSERHRYPAAPAPIRTLVVDTMGELDALYAAADVAVIGGSFGRHHGHNFLEPAWHGKPILCGPDMANFQGDLELFLREQAILQVQDRGGLAAGLRMMLEPGGPGAAMGARAREIVEAARGIGEKLAGEVVSDLEAAADEARPPRVLLCVSSAGIGGGERHVTVLAEHLARSGLADPAISCRPGGWIAARARKLDLPCHPLPYRDAFDPLGALALRRLVRDGGFDLVHGHLNVASLQSSAAAWLAGVPSLVTAHGMTRALYYRLAGRVIAVSEAVARHLSGRAPSLGRRIRRIYSGLPSGQPPSAESTARLLERLRIPAETIVFTVVGKLHPNKNQGLLIEAAARLEESPEAHVARGDRPAWLVLLVGDGPERRRLEALAERLAVPVRFAGEIDDVAGVLAVTGLLVVPSLQEAFGLAALEALLAGVPVAAAATGGIPELVVPGETGTLFPPADAEALASVLRRFLNRPDDFRDAARAARAVVEARFRPERMAEEVAGEYRRVLEWPPALMPPRRSVDT